VRDLFHKQFLSQRAHGLFRPRRISRLPPRLYLGFWNGYHRRKDFSSPAFSYVRLLSLAEPESIAKSFRLQSSAYFKPSSPLYCWIIP
jgi:hypothetical protein